MKWLPAFKKKAPPQTSWLQWATEWSLDQWVSFIQHRISKNTKPSVKFPGHGETNLTGWVDEVTGYVIQKRPEGFVDTNMWTAAVLGQIFSLWYIRIQRAKALDPRRPVALRQDAYHRWRFYVLSMIALVVDESQDPQMFPGQLWENPFLPDATDGDFV